MIQAAVRPASSGLWEAPVAISPEWAESPAVAVDSRGDAVAAWSVRYPEGGAGYAENDTIQAAARPAVTGVWQPPQWVSEFGKAPYKNRFSLWPQVAIDAEGKAIAVWGRSGDRKRGLAQSNRSFGEGAQQFNLGTLGGALRGGEPAADRDELARAGGRCVDVPWRLVRRDAAGALGYLAAGCAYRDDRSGLPARDT